MCALAETLPTEILQQIYYYLHPVDFEAARNTCSAWNAGSLSPILLQAMARRAGWSSYTTVPPDQSNSDFVAQMDDLLSHEAALHPHHHRYCRPHHTRRRSHDETVSSRVETEWPNIRRSPPATIPITRTTHVSLADLVASNDLKNPTAPPRPSSLLPTISNCVRFLLLTNNCTIYIYAFVSAPTTHTSPTLHPITSIHAPRRVIAVSMDTSAGRFAVAALLDSRVGMVCELDDGGESLPRMPSPGVYARPVPPDVVDEVMGGAAAGESRALVRYTGGSAARSPDSQGTQRGQGRGDGDFQGGEVNTIHIRSPTQNVHLFNASMYSNDQRTWPATTTAAPIPVFGIAERETITSTPDSIVDVSEPPIALSDDDASDSAPPTSSPSSQTAFPSAQDANGGEGRLPTKREDLVPTTMPTHASPVHLYSHICSPNDPPRSVAICPSRQCVAFGCAAGVELHWVSGSARASRFHRRGHDDPTRWNTGGAGATDRGDGGSSRWNEDGIHGGSDRSLTLRTGDSARRNLMKWFPLTAPSEVLAFLPWREGVDRGNRLRLVSSVDLPIASLRRRWGSASGNADADSGVELRGFRGWEGVMGARGRVWRALRRWAWDFDYGSPVEQVGGVANRWAIGDWDERAPTLSASNQTSTIPYEDEGAAEHDAEQDDPHPQQIHYEVDDVPSNELEGPDGSGFDHYRALPLSDGTHLLFVDPASGDLMLGSDNAPLTGAGGTARLLRKVRFVPPSCAFSHLIGKDAGAGRKGKDKRRRKIPTAYTASRDLKQGVRVVAAYGDAVVLYTIPPDVFADLERVGGSHISYFGTNANANPNANATANAAAPPQLNTADTREDDGDEANPRAAKRRRPQESEWGEWASWWGHERPLPRSSTDASTGQRRWRGDGEPNQATGVTGFLPLVVRGVLVGVCKGCETLAVTSGCDYMASESQGRQGFGELRGGAEGRAQRGGCGDGGMDVWAFGEGGREGVVWTVGRNRVGISSIGREEDMMVKVLADGSVVHVDRDGDEGGE